MRNLAGPYDQFRRRLDAFNRESKGVYTGDVEALHRARVASRRLRELLPVLGLDGDTVRKLGRRLKKVTRRLGAMRELDVLMLIIQELARDARYSSMALKQLGAGVEEARAAAHARLTAKLPLANVRRLAYRLERAVSQRESDEGRGHRRIPHRSHQAWVWALEARATRRAIGVRAAIETAGAVYVPERLHDVRIALKKLRYALELVAEARGQRANGEIAILRDAQDLLGRLRDLQVLVERARHEQASLSVPAVRAWRELGSLVDAVEDDCRALHARYMHGRSKLIAIADRVGHVKHHPAVVN